MSSGINIISSKFKYNLPEGEWDLEHWKIFDENLKRRALSKKSDLDVWRTLTNGARFVMRKYTTSFYLVSRFLPPEKRRKVEAIYAAVRYPDEIVDTFNISSEEKIQLLNDWTDWYYKTLSSESLYESLQNGAPSFISSFSYLVRKTGIPTDYYLSFLDAMRQDVKNTYYNSINDLIEKYVYGSAIVVGYFLAYVYGASKKEEFQRALLASRNLGIALQLTNFMRDVNDDNKRDRLYIPLDLLKRYGLKVSDLKNKESIFLLKQIIDDILDIAENYYADASLNLDAFADDCQTAIDACIKVYRELNSMIRRSNDSLTKRLSVPFIQKFRVLPASKYWRIPSAFLFGT